MKKVLFLGLVVSLASVRIAFAQLQHALYYHPAQKLQWESFQPDVVEVEASAKPELFSVSFMKPVRIQPKHKVEAATGLVMVQTDAHPLTGVAKFKTFAVLYKQRSWMDPDHRDERTLAHAQMHFDLTELYARLLEAELNDRKINANNFMKMGQIHRQFQSLLQEALNQLDAETQGGENQEKVRAWEDKIARQLASRPREGE